MSLQLLLRHKSGNKLMSPTPKKVFPNAQWEHLRATRQLPEEERPLTAVLELVSGSKNATRGAFTGFGHTFIRLISSQGEVYSVGFYPDESTGLIPENTPALTMPGMMLNPDKYDLINKHEVRTVIQLTKQQFIMVKQHLEDMQRRKQEGALQFRLLDRNCVWFALHIASQVGVDIDADYSHLTRGVQLIFKPFRPFLLATNKLIPTLIIKPFTRGMLRLNQLITNSVYFLLGGRVTVCRQWIKDENEQFKSLKISDLQPMFPTISAIWRRKIPCLHVKTFREWQLKNNPHEC
jgi:hypothetical protein